jgi:urease beta subunit
VLVAGHQVGFDSVRKLWYCDIAVDTGPAYFPFVRLALARYQPNSLTNAHLSRAVLADFVQTVQGRTFTVVRSGTNPLLLTVTAVGISYTATRNADQSLRTGPSTMRVQLEQRSHKLAGDFGWEAVGSPIELSPSQSGTDTTWTGRVLLPSGNWPLRLVVEEVEKLSADGTFGPTGTLERLVYTDIVPVSPDQFGVLTPTPSSVDFGPVNANQDHAVATVSVKNTGAAPLTVGAVSIIGTDAAQFSIDTDTASGAVLNPGLTASVVVRFTPTQIGTFNAQLDFPDDAIPNPLDVNLTGVGQGAVLGVQPTSLNFGNQAVGVMSPQMTLTLTNSGNANLVIGTTSIVGSSQASFQIVTDASGVTVPPGGNTNMTLTARPISGGSNAATLMIPSNAAGSPLSVGLNCVGV